MTRMSAVGILVLLSLCSLGASKPVKQPSSSTGIRIVSGFVFQIQGDGVSTSLSITPQNIPQIEVGSGTTPHLPLVGIIEGSGTCSDGSTFTGQAAGRQLVVTFPSPPASGAAFTCSAALLYQPQ